MKWGFNVLAVPVTRVFFFNFLFFFNAILVQGQQKQQLAPELWPEVQAEFVFKSTSFLFFRHQYRFTTNQDYQGLHSPILNNQLKRIQFRVGYEHVLTNAWGVGGSQMFSFEPGRKLFFTDVYLRHLSSIVGLQVIKRLMVDYLQYTTTSSVGRLRPRLDLDKALKINNLPIRLRAGYELFLYTDFKSTKPYVGRIADRTRLRFEVAIQPNPHLTFTPFFTKQTDYSQLPDKVNEQTKTVIAGENQNSITPIWGVEFRYTIFQGNKPFPRIPMPVQQD
ncbi:DUF2490 domain-containing protein [Adhaeribacter swui]|uniref:DUF2490 domain-containing protein n=1 Tax=Adhaeribacter swui TaxID=2086471 RepID=A0A7G7G3M4_9BACT|nr:DUF2490 domain-containing protein [Adhaeribacter swui]QNF31758.1 DUF2490 domain-containing protein [Adhaeribacter swui]